MDEETDCRFSPLSRKLERTHQNDTGHLLGANFHLAEGFVDLLLRKVILFIPDSSD